MKIAIIGSGISGMGAAWLLHGAHDITLYEKEARCGGHSRTIDVTVDGITVPVDTGFIVFNYRNYPNLAGLFKQLDVPVEKSDMSFGACVGGGNIEYGSKGIFAQKRNILRPAYWRMLADILRFNHMAPDYIDNAGDMTLRELLARLGTGDWFNRYYLQAMGAAIWSCSVETILDFPARTFLRFFANHGLLTVNDHPQWYTVTGGSRSYVERVTAGFVDHVRLSCGVKRVERRVDGVYIEDERGESHRYDQVVFSCHADQALKMIVDPTAAERSILGGFRYQDNHVVVHSDSSFMPRRKKAWASWVYLSEEGQDRRSVVSLTYWMNNLQNLKTPRPLLVTLNPGRAPAADLVHDEHVFRHPVFDLAAIKAQEKITAIQGRDRLWFCGAYQRYGFHEDGLLSAVEVARALGAKIPWD